MQYSTCVTLLLLFFIYAYHVYIHVVHARMVLYGLRRCGGGPVAEGWNGGGVHVTDRVSSLGFIRPPACLDTCSSSMHCMHAFVLCFFFCQKINKEARMHSIATTVVPLA